MHHGQCFCGSVTFTAKGNPKAARMCWCRDCQRIASGSATVNILFDETDMSYSGALTTITRTADSGNIVERGFCPVCGSQMYSKTCVPSGMPMRVRAGTLNDPEIMAPTAIIWALSAPKWAVLDPQLLHRSHGPDSPVIHDPTVQTR